MNKEKITVVKCFGYKHGLWVNDKSINEFRVKMILDFCYSRLQARKYLFLNEVYEELGIPLTREGQIAGWIYTKDCMKDIMWTVWTKDDEFDDVYITFEPIRNILNMLPEDEDIK